MNGNKIEQKETGADTVGFTQAGNKKTGRAKQPNKNYLQRTLVRQVAFYDFDMMCACM